MPASVTVAIPTLDAGPGFIRTLEAVRSQLVDREVELLVCDSGSSDETVALAVQHGARVLRIARSEFSHGATRNLLMSEARGDHVAFLTQDAVPADDAWLQSLLAGFARAPDVGLCFGPYRPPAGTSLSVAREIDAWFASFDTDRVDVLDRNERSAPPRSFLGHRGYFTDANGCVARAAWSVVPFRPVAYAEDHLLAQDMLRAGFAKVYVADAAVLHAHEYTFVEGVRRSFDESRAVQDIYAFRDGPRALLRNLRGGVTGDVRAGSLQVIPVSLAHHGAIAIGAFLGARSTALPRRAVRRLSLEGRT